MGDILFLAHRIPYPPDKGDKIRSWNMLRYLAERATVHLGAFVDDPADRVHAETLRPLCGEMLLQPLRRPQRAWRAARGLRRGEPLSIALFQDPAMAAFVHRTVERHAIDRILVFSSQMAPYALRYLTGQRRSVMDFVDVDSEKWRQYAENSRGWRQRLFAREARLLRAFEMQVSRAFDVSLFVSQAEAALFRRLAGEAAHNALALSNGVDTAIFQPGAVAPQPGLPHPSFVFTGAMDYRPNIDAVVWFVERVWPTLRAAHADASFAIVGSNPSPEVRRLGAVDGVLVTGRVPDVRPWLAAADAVVAPLQIARGIQNKVLEAMAMAKPVVATAAAFEGIDAEPGRHLLVADDPADFAAAALALIDHPKPAAAMGAAARAQVEAHYSWPARLAPLDAFLTA